MSEIAEELEIAAENAVSAVEAFEEAKTAEVETAEAEHGSGAKTTLLILTFVIIGMLGGYYVVPRFFSDLQVFQDMSGSWLTAGICILLGLVGFSMGLSGNRGRKSEDDWLSGIVLPVRSCGGQFARGRAVWAALAADGRRSG